MKEIYKELGDAIDSPPDMSEMTYEQKLKTEIDFLQECTRWLKRRLKEVKEGATAEGR